MSDPTDSPLPLGDGAGSSTAAEGVGLRSSLLGVDVIQLAHGKGFAGTIAAIVESREGCTYRIVDADGAPGYSACQRKGVGVHVRGAGMR